MAFSAMPHKESAQEIRHLLDRGIKVVDLSADFRLREAAQYPAWYGFNHPAPQLLEQAVYGLTELHRNEITSAQLVANPGCYATGALLALAPAVKQGLINGHFIIDSKSGISGAGRSLDLKAHYAEANEDVTAYALDGHRHLPEIVQELKQLRPQPLPSVTFVPHLVPMTRGLLTTCYTPLHDELASSPQSKERLRQIYFDFYKDEPFIKVVSTPPHSKHTLGSNMCIIHPTIDTRTGRLVVVSCIDNLVKGAAGQAIQNMNLMLGLPEISGLEAKAVWP
jgi:N-acetyl-gamma-glutamyl-phosphate reductase